MLEVYNLLDKIDFLKEVAILEYEEWTDNKEKDKKNRIAKKIENEENIIDEDLKNREDTIIALLLDANQKIFQKIKEKMIVMSV